MDPSLTVVILSTIQEAMQGQPGAGGAAHSDPAWWNALPLLTFCVVLGIGLLVIFRRK